MKTDFPGAKAWYREPWPWLLMAGPAAVIVAGLFTVGLAVRSDDGLVAADYYKDGLVINRMLERDRRARELGIAAEAELSGSQVRIRVSGAPAVSLQLRLRLVHPTGSGEDGEATLALRDGGLYAGQLNRPVLAGAPSRRLILEDRLGGWRIAGELNRGNTRAHLEAAP